MAWRRTLVAVVLFSACFFCSSARAWQCCCWDSPTLREEMQASRCVVLVRRMEMPTVVLDEPREISNQAAEEGDDDLPRAQFRVVEVLKQDGETRFGRVLTLQMSELTADDVDGVFYATCDYTGGWSLASPVEPSSHAYLRALAHELISAPRAKFYLDHWASNDPWVARDAIDELLSLDHKQLVELRPHIDREQAWQDIRRTNDGLTRRLALRLVGVSGTVADAEALEKMIVSERSPRGLDELCLGILRLKGIAGVPLLEERFLKNSEAEYADTYSTLIALREWASTGGDAERLRARTAMRLLLDRPDMADLVIVDLAQMEDWDSMDRIVALFRESPDKDSWVRVPAFRYLLACPLPAAHEHVRALREVDPAAYARTLAFFPLELPARPGLD
jgi:hypothetical protein